MCAVDPTSKIFVVRGWVSELSGWLLLFHYWEAAAFLWNYFPTGSLRVKEGLASQLIQLLGTSLGNLTWTAWLCSISCEKSPTLRNPRLSFLLLESEIFGNGLPFPLVESISIPLLKVEPTEFHEPVPSSYSPALEATPPSKFLEWLFLGDWTTEPEIGVWNPTTEPVTNLWTNGSLLDRFFHSLSELNPMKLLDRPLLRFTLFDSLIL